MSEENKSAAVTTGSAEAAVSPDSMALMIQTLLENMQSKMEDMSNGILGKIDTMADRISTLESTITDLQEQTVKLQQEKELAEKKLKQSTSSKEPCGPS